MKTKMKMLDAIMIIGILCQYAIIPACSVYANGENSSAPEAQSPLSDSKVVREILLCFYEMKSDKIHALSTGDVSIFEVQYNEGNRKYDEVRQIYKQDNISHNRILGSVQNGNVRNNSSILCMNPNKYYKVSLSGFSYGVVFFIPPSEKYSKEIPLSEPGMRLRVNCVFLKKMPAENKSVMFAMENAEYDNDNTFIYLFKGKAYDMRNVRTYNIQDGGERVYELPCIEGSIAVVRENIYGMSVLLERWQMSIDGKIVKDNKDLDVIEDDCKTMIIKIPESIRHKYKSGWAMIYKTNEKQQLLGWYMLPPRHLIKVNKYRNYEITGEFPISLPKGKYYLEIVLNNEGVVMHKDIEIE